jgi:hypothetical protein
VPALGFVFDRSLREIKGGIRIAGWSKELSIIDDAIIVLGTIGRASKAVTAISSS